MKRPDLHDAPAYFHKYTDLVSDGDVIAALERQAGETLELLAGIEEEGALRRYAPDKWSIKELVGHVIDTERIFAYRGLVLARGDSTPLPGFEQDDYIEHAALDRRPWESLIGEFRDLRSSNVALFRSLEEEAWNRPGTVDGNPFTARAVPWILAGHELWHVGVLRERYMD